MEQPRECKHLGNPPGQYSVGEYARKWGFSRQRPNANKFIPLFNTSKKRNAKLTREGMADTKPRTPPSSARQIYGKVPAKIFHTLFWKVIDSQETRQQKICKNMGETCTARGACACIKFWNNSETQIARSIMHMKKNWMQNMQPMYAQWLYRVWTTFLGMVQQTFRCQLQ